MWYVMKCGCTVDVDVYTPYGCCCGECYSYDSTEVEDVTFVSMCDEHSN